MRDGDKAKGTASRHASRQKAGAAASAPLCRFEELALRENRLRQAAVRRGKE